MVVVGLFVLVLVLEAGLEASPAGFWELSFAGGAAAADDDLELSVVWVATVGGAGGGESGGHWGDQLRAAED
jgi:hypothetical protein